MIIKESADAIEEITTDIEDVRGQFKQFKSNVENLMKKIRSYERTNALEGSGDWWKASLSYLADDLDDFNTTLLDFGEEHNIF